MNTVVRAWICWEASIMKKAVEHSYWSLSILAELFSQDVNYSRFCCKNMER